MKGIIFAAVLLLGIFFNAGAEVDAGGGVIVVGGFTDTATRVIFPSQPTPSETAIEKSFARFVADGLFEGEIRQVSTDFDENRIYCLEFGRPNSPLLKTIGQLVSSEDRIKTESTLHCN